MTDFLAINTEDARNIVTEDHKRALLDHPPVDIAGPSGALFSLYLVNYYDGPSAAASRVQRVDPTTGTILATYTNTAPVDTNSYIYEYYGLRTIGKYLTVFARSRSDGGFGVPWNAPFLDSWGFLRFADEDALTLTNPSFVAMVNSGGVSNSSIAGVSYMDTDNSAGYVVQCPRPGGDTGTADASRVAVYGYDVETGAMTYHQDYGDITGPPAVSVNYFANCKQNPPRVFFHIAEDEWFSAGGTNESNGGLQGLISNSIFRRSRPFAPPTAGFFGGDILGGDDLRTTVLGMCYAAERGDLFIQWDGNAATIADSSGGNHDGYYRYSNFMLFGQPGLVSGNASVVLNAVSQDWIAEVPVPTSPSLVAAGNDFWINFWTDLDLDNTFFFQLASFFALDGSTELRIYNGGSGAGFGGTTLSFLGGTGSGKGLLVGFGNLGPITFGGGATGTPRMVTIIFKGSTGGGLVYVNGSLVYSGGFSGGAFSGGFGTPVNGCLFGGLGDICGQDEWAWGSGVPSGASLAVLYAQASVSAAAYAAAQLALGSTCTNYYRMADSGTTARHFIIEQYTYHGYLVGNEGLLRTHLFGIELSTTAFTVSKANSFPGAMCAGPGGILGKLYAAPYMTDAGFTQEIADGVWVVDLDTLSGRTDPAWTLGETGGPFGFNIIRDMIVPAS